MRGDVGMKNALSTLVLALGVGMVVWGLVHCLDHNQPWGVQLLGSGTLLVAAGAILYR